jgi:single-stranded DNA-binding protein
VANNARISLFGTVLQEPTNKQVNNSTVFSMRVGVQTTKKQEGSQWPASDVYDVAVWGKPGEALISKIKAKTKVWVTGDFMVGEPWKDRQGKEHLSLRVNASHVVVTSGGNYTNNSNNNQQAPEVEEEAPF